MCCIVFIDILVYFINSFNYFLKFLMFNGFYVVFIGFYLVSQPIILFIDLSFALRFFSTKNNNKFAGLTR